MMHEPELLTLPLQNHLLVLRHLATHAGFWMPQYLSKSRQGHERAAFVVEGKEVGWDHRLPGLHMVLPLEWKGCDRTCTHIGTCEYSASETNPMLLASC
jgi:hypothetical protein